MNLIRYIIILVPLMAVEIMAQNQLLTQKLLGGAYKGSKDNRIQVTVANQFSMPDSATDCGYHAFYNGLAIAYLVKAAPGDLQHGLARFGDTQAAADARVAVFGTPDSAWRKAVAEIRADRKATKPLREALSNAINPTLDVKERTAIQNVIKRAALAIARESHSLNADSVAYRADADLIKRELKEALQASVEDKNVDLELKEVYQKLVQEGLEEYLNPQTVEFPVERDPATWLYSDEIVPLASHVASENLFDNSEHELKLFSLGDTIGSNQPLASELKIVDPEFKQLQKDMRDPSSNALAVILLYVKEGEIDPFAWVTSLKDWFFPPTVAQKMASETEESSKGHWITLVVNKVGPEVQYITADSGGNASRLDDKRVNEVITLLTGEKPKVHSKKTNVTFQRSAANSWRQWQKPFKIALSTAVMVAACLFIARTMNKEGQKAKKNS